MSVQRTNMHRLRERLAKDFEEILNVGEPLMVNGEPLVIDGKVVMKRPAPAMYNVIRQFLRDNGIDREPVDLPNDKPSVVANLPFHEDPSEIEGLPPHLLTDRSE
jgi:hypothetical protein